MSDQTVTLRIVGESGKLVAAVKVSKSEVDGLAKAATAAGKTGAKGMEEVGKGAQKSRRDIASMTGSLKGMAADAKRYGTIAGLAITAVAGVATAVAAAYVRNSIESEKVQSQLLSRIKDTAGAAHRSLEQLNAQAAKLQSQTIFDDEAIGNAQAMLLTFKNIKDVRFDQATAAVLDMSTAMGQDAVSSAVQLGKALNDPITGLSARSKIGVTFSDGQKKVIEKMVETGNVAGAQGVILDELASQMGTAAEAARDTLGGSVTALKNSFDNLLEGDSGSGGLTGARDGIEALNTTINDPAIKRGVDSTVEGLLAIANAALQVIGAIGNAGSALAEFFAANDKKSLVSLRNKQVDLETQLYGEQRAGRTAYGAMSQGLARLTGIGPDPAQTQRDLDAVTAEITRRNKEGMFSGVAATTNASWQGKPTPGGLSDAAKAAAAKAAAAAAKAAAAAARDLAKAEDEAARAAQAMTAAQDAATASLEDWRAELAGPAAQAILKYTRMERELDLQVAAGELSWEKYAIAMDTVAQMREQDIDLMSDQQKAVRDMAENQKRAAEDYQHNWQGAISSVAGAMGDFFASGLRDSKSFTQGLKDIFKRWLSNVIAIFADGQLKKAFAGVTQSVSGWMANLGGGGGGGAGGGSGSLTKSVLGMFTGGGGSGSGTGMLSSMYSGFTNGFASAGASGSGFWGSLVNGFSGAVSAFTGSLGAASTATSAYGTMISGLASTYGGVGVGGATAAGSTGMGAISGVMKVLAAVPVWGWIVAAVVAAVAGGAIAYKNGWRMEGQKSDQFDYYSKKGMVGAAVGGAVVGAADTFLRALGFKDSWAAALSGSSLHTKAFGHKMPKVQAQGFQGSIGFGGFDGQSTADMKAKGGWFRSDKKWTETGEMNATLDRAFDNVAMGVAMRATDLADQMGIDITTALAAVKIEIPKLNLDEDPEKARAQISELIGAMMEDLSAEAVKALGFTRLLDDGFQAGEIMGALSASIALVTGSADNLGRALSALEIENVARAVEYFEAMSIKNGGSLGDEIGRVVGLLGEYSSLITGVDTELQTRDLNQYQSAQLQIELQYRSQIKSANTLAKALGLTGARAEDLAKIEQLRAVNMASLQTAMEAQKNTFLDDLGLSDLSPLRDDEKLAESMQLLRDAVGSGDMQRAQQLSQQALGFGRNLYASGKDYSGLYDEVTGLIGGMNPASLEGFTDLQLDNIADILTGLPDGIAAAMFNLLYGPATTLTPAPIAPPPPNPNTGTGGTGGGGGFSGGNDDGMYAMLSQISAQLASIDGNTGGSLQQQRSDSLATMNR